VRGELEFARNIAETFLHEAERGTRTTECGFGRRLLGATCLWQGDLIEAQSNFVEALKIYDPERDREAMFRFDQDTGAAAKACLANTKWQLGEVGPARVLIEEAVAHAIKTGHIPTLVNIYFYKTHFETIRGDAAATRRGAKTVVELSQENAITLFEAWGVLYSAWASARLDGHETGATGLRQALAAYTDQGNKISVPFFQSSDQLSGHGKIPDLAGGSISYGLMANTPGLHELAFAIASHDQHRPRHERHEQDQFQGRRPEE
jgi:hypothetical protein